MGEVIFACWSNENTNTKSKLFNLNSQIWSRGWCTQVDGRPEEEQGLDGEDQGAGGQAPGGGDGS